MAEASENKESVDLEKQQSLEISQTTFLSDNPQQNIVLRGFKACVRFVFWSIQTTYSGFMNGLTSTIPFDFIFFYGMPILGVMHGKFTGMLQRGF